MWITDWTAHAACKGTDPDELFVQGPAQNRAKLICRGCPVRTECLADALDNGIEFGVWGGMTDRERRALLRRRPDVTSWRELLERARDQYERHVADELIADGGGELVTSLPPEPSTTRTEVCSFPSAIAPARTEDYRVLSRPVSLAQTIASVLSRRSQRTRQEAPGAVPVDAAVSSGQPSEAAGVATQRAGRAWSDIIQELGL